MNTKMKVKISVDILMTIVLFIVMSYQYTGEKNHEIAGAVMLILFILHHFLNLSWYKNLAKGKYKAARILQTAIDFLLLVDMLGLMVSGIAMSRYVFTFVDLGIGASIARTLHMICSYAGFLLMGLHIGLHYGMIINMVAKMFGITKKQILRRIILRCIAIVIAVYGMYALVERDLFSYILQKNQFVFFDYEEPAILFLMDYVAIMGLMIFVSYYLQKIIVKLAKEIKKKKEIIKRSN